MHPWPKINLFSNFGIKSGKAKNIDLENSFSTKTWHHFNYRLPTDYILIGYDGVNLILIYCKKKLLFLCSNYFKSKKYAPWCPNNQHFGWVLKSSNFYKIQTRESIDFYLITKWYNTVSKNVKIFQIYSVFKFLIFGFRIWPMVHIVLSKDAQVWSCFFIRNIFLLAPYQETHGFG